MAELMFVDMHNQAFSITDLPAAQKEYQSLFNGLKNCSLSYALQQNPSKCSVCINDFWKHAEFIELQEGDVIKTTVQGIPMVVTEQTIREVLKFKDQPHFPTSYPTDQVVPVLTRMGYEGSYPPTKKKLLLYGI